VKHALAIVAALLVALGAHAEEPRLRLASTPSTRDSGLFDAILPKFEASSGIAVDVIAVGTGRALDLGRRGDVDAVLVHDEASELAFVQEGWGIERRAVMYNYFLLVGPKDDPAGVRLVSDPVAALRRIAAAQATFVSRGDDSGTNKAELRLWKAAGIEPSGAWYRETGSGMGATLNTAAELPAYTLVDSGTWLAFKNRRGLEPVLEGADLLRNPYSIILVNPARHPHVQIDLARTFAAWLTGEEGAKAISEVRVGGVQLFHPYPQP
jgi:tungstate transport system substrate-binding protein